MQKNNDTVVKIKLKDKLKCEHRLVKIAYPLFRDRTIRVIRRPNSIPKNGGTTLRLEMI